jgi:hypothetical protein
MKNKNLFNNISRKLSRGVSHELSRTSAWQSMATMTIAALCLCASVVLFTGCAATPLATKPVTTHVVHIAGSGKKLGIVQDPVTGQYSLGYQSIFVGVTTVPITTAMDTNGVVHFIEPDAVASYEIAGKNGIFGSAGSTYTVAVGENAVQTILGGQHSPVNAGFYGTNNIVTSSPQPSTVSSPTPATPPITPSASK